MNVEMKHRRRLSTKETYRTFSSGLPCVRDERLSRSPLMVLVDNGLVTVVTFEGDENDASSTVEVNGDGCSDNTLDDDD